jgi:hypothetical protein
MGLPLEMVTAVVTARHKKLLAVQPRSVDDHKSSGIVRGGNRLALAAKQLVAFSVNLPAGPITLTMDERSVSTWQRVNRASASAP